MKTRRLFIVLAGLLVLSTTSVFAQDWSQWRGSNRDGKVSGFEVPGAWPAELSPKWKVTVGLGDASPVISGNNIYNRSL